MVEALAGLSGTGKVFATAAALGGVLFFARLLLQFLGGHTDGADGLHGDVTHDVAGDSDLSFKILSFQGLTAFFMMFGLVGLALDQSRAAGGLAFLGAFCAGLGSVWLISKIFSSLSKLQSSGTLNMANAIGEEGTVYLRIPPGGTGKAQITIQGRLMVFDAVAEKPEETLLTGDRVVVRGVVRGDVLVLAKGGGAV